MSDDVSSYGSTQAVEDPYDEEEWAAEYEEALDNVAAVAGLVLFPPGVDPDDVPIVLGDDARLDPDTPADAHITTIAGSDLITGPGQLHLLARLKHEGYDADTLHPLAASLVRDDIDDQRRREVAARLVDVVQYAPGSDPLGRTIHHLDAADGPPPGPLPEEPHQLVSFLQDDVSTSIYGSLPQCDAEREEVDGEPALYIETRGWSTVPLDKFDMMVDPINWPKCPLQATFFKSMVPDGTPDQPLPFPEKKGWRNDLIETVDFGMGVLGSAFAMETVLSVMYYKDDKSTGCTYELVRSLDGKISHDQGYLLAQDMEAPDGTRAREITTMKSVWFTDPMMNLPASFICPVWSLASAMLSHACLDRS
jgi:hypothetical protein